MIMTPKVRHSLVLLAIMSILACATWSGATVQNDDLAKKVRDLDVRILTADKDQAKVAANMVYSDVRARIKAANKRETMNWRNLKDRAAWEKYRDERIEALRKSLGEIPQPPSKPKITITRTLPGDGFQMLNLVYETRPGLLVSANLYLPAKKVESMPGIIVIHSHHNPKTQSELQDMGMLWARLGCAVLVPEQLGHGERRQHPFLTAKDYAKPFKPGRQDYYFRYNVAQQLHLVGESLMGWMVWDLMRGVDVLLAQKNIDKKAIILMGSVAGGGDPCAVTAALDPRITAAVPFNFGGPQPETTFPLPADPEDAFNYVGGGSWESTRNLKWSARDGFLPWVIVGANAPRPLIYAHEFAWDKEHDPVWKRLQQIYKWYDVPDHLVATHGKGKVSGKAGPDNTHCNNIGAVHRQMIYPALKLWFAIPVPKVEFHQPKPKEDLQCLTPELAMQNRRVHELARLLASKQIDETRKQFAKLSFAKRQDKMRQTWSQLLGGIDVDIVAKKVDLKDTSQLGTIKVIKLVLNVEREIQVPVLLLIPTAKTNEKIPVVVAVAQQGHAGFIKHRSEHIAALLDKGVAVCLPDVRGSGETQMGGRGRTSLATSLSATELMLGKTVLGGQCHDLLALMRYLGERPELNGDKIMLWGDSFAPVNDKERDLAVPLDADDLPSQGEPMGANLALLGALFQPKIRCVYARGGLGSYLSVLDSPFLYLPHDAIIPGAAAASDVSDLVGTLAPRALWLEAMIDGTNRPFTLKDNPLVASALTQHQVHKAGKALRLVDHPTAPPAVATWALEALGNTN
jgi:cephalosporin-C deacetylase-like acetyl esterase